MSDRSCVQCIKIPKEKEAEIKEIAKSNNVTIGKLFIEAIEHKYGVQFESSK